VRGLWEVRVLVEGMQGSREGMERLRDVGKGLEGP